MRPVFIIVGYGIPKDILQDENYQIYLKVAFNNVWNQTTSEDRPLILMCGGPTDMYEPYERTEADEMIRAFRVLMDRDAVRERTANWELSAEDRSLSTLENLLFAREILHERGITDAQVTIIGEETRAKRLIETEKQVLSEFEVDVITIDFDQSLNRYLDPEFLAKKEALVAKADALALQDPVKLQQLHELYEEKLTFLRERGPEKHAEAVRDWWQKKLAEFEDFSEK